VTYDEAAQLARAAADALTPCDYGSTIATHDVARLMRVAYLRGRRDRVAEQVEFAADAEEARRRRNEVTGRWGLPANPEPGRDEPGEASGV
jgi:hypothetical protein